MLVHCCLAGLCVLVPLISFAQFERRSPYGIALVAMCWAFAGFVAVILHGRRICALPQAELTRQLLMEARCPSCCYKLEHTRIEPDGCTLCSECGAAWKLPPPEPAVDPSSLDASTTPQSAAHDWFPFAAATADRTITDAKGHRVSLIPVIDRSRWPKHLAESSWRACNHAAAWPAVPYIVMGYVALALVGFVVIDLAILFPRGAARGWFALVLGAYVVIAAYFIFGPPRDARHARAKLGAGHCPACAAKLDLSVLDPHGHHVCPTCAASWHPADRKKLRLRPRLFHAPPVVTGDHRGIMHPIFDAEIFRPPSDNPQFLSRDEYRTLRKEFLATDWYATVNKILSILAIIWASSVIVDHIRQGRPPVTFGILLGFSLIWTLRAWRGLGNDPRRLIEALIKRHRCGSCGNDLRSLEPADDACTVCPECGAAWKLRDAQ